LPAVDDGAETLGEALEMLELAKRNGTKEIVLTPHFPNDNLENDVIDSVYQRKMNSFINDPKVREIGIKLYQGAENLCTPLTLKNAMKRQLITINNTEYALIEFMQNEHCSFMRECAEVLIREGYTPIIAHAERYFYLQRQAQTVKEFKKMGCLIQVNSNSLLCGGIRERFADWIFGNMLADAVASDAHNMFSRTSNLSTAYEELSHRYSFAYAEKLLETNPSKIISGKNIR